MDEATAADQLVRAVLSAWERRDTGFIVDHFTDDAVRGHGNHARCYPVLRAFVKSEVALPGDARPADHLCHRDADRLRSA